MQYTLITKSGKILTFFIKATAEMYRNIYGGVVITKEIFEQEETVGV